MKIGWILLIAFLVLAGLKACHRPVRERNLLVTIEVETPQGLRTGRTVIQTLSRARAKWLGPIASGGAEAYGEAPSVDLGGGRYLFATLEDPNFRRRIYDWRYPQQPGPDHVVKPADYPMLVTFADIADPRSVVEVHPDALAARFGPGYRLRAIRAEPTERSPEYGRIEQVLRWKDRMGPVLDPTRYARAGPDLPAALGWASFSRRPANW